jgi:Rieske Fe-S protein
MERKDFIKTCGFACLGGIGISTLLQSCATMQQTLTGEIAESDLMVSVSDFRLKTSGKNQFKKYIIVDNERLRFPICVFRFDEQNYSALWMECTHMGNEVQVFGDKLQCLAHGSELSNRGVMQHGPAEANLRSFPVTVTKDHLKISLKAV